MSILGVNNILAAYQYDNKTQRTETRNNVMLCKSSYSAKTDFAKQLQNTAESGQTRVDSYTEYLKSKYGMNISAKNVSRDQKSIDAVGSGTSGTGNVVIARNILDEMANNPEKAAYYEEKIQNYFNSVPRYEAELSAMGHEIHSSGIIIHPDGTVTHYISGDLKPEVRAKIEAKVKAEQEEKAKRRREYLENSRKAAEERREMMEAWRQNQIKADMIHTHIMDMNNSIGITQMQEMASVTAACENAISSYTGSLSQNG